MKLIPTWDVAVLPSINTLCLSAICSFFFPPITPQGTLGHSWQKTQIGFKAKLSRLKKWAIQPRTDGILCCGFFLLLLSLPSAHVSNPFSHSAGDICNRVLERAYFKNVAWNLFFFRPWMKSLNTLFSHYYLKRQKRLMKTDQATNEKLDITVGITY